MLERLPPVGAPVQVIDMSVNGEGEWQKWNNGSGLWGSAADKGQFIWTTLHDFGGTDGLKGDIGRINNIPFEAAEAKANVWCAAAPTRGPAAFGVRLRSIGVGRGTGFMDCNSTLWP